MRIDTWTNTMESQLPGIYLYIYCEKLTISWLNSLRPNYTLIEI